MIKILMIPFTFFEPVHVIYQMMRNVPDQDCGIAHLFPVQGCSIGVRYGVWIQVFRFAI